jgi:hypothetical protein
MTNEGPIKKTRNIQPEISHCFFIISIISSQLELFIEDHLHNHGSNQARKLAEHQGNQKFCKPDRNI